MRDPSQLTQALAITPPYLESRDAHKTVEYRDWSIALGRRFRALKLWFVLRSYGAEGLRQMIRNHIAWAKELAVMIRTDARFELVTGPNLSLLTLRLRPDPDLSTSQLNALNTELLRRLNDNGRVYLTKSHIEERVVIRFAIGQTYTAWHHVEEGWREIQTQAAALLSNVEVSG